MRSVPVTFDFFTTDFDIEEEDFLDEDDLNIRFPTLDKLVQRTSHMTASSTQSSATLMLPHSFDTFNKKKKSSGSTESTNSLTMSPQHQYRANSISGPVPSSDNLVNRTLKRAKSAESANVLSTDDEARLIKERVSPDQLKSHMADIVE